MFRYSNNGLSFGAVDLDYVAEPGEVLFSDYATPYQLTAAFSGYAKAIQSQSQIIYTQAAQNMLDTTVKTQGYDGILSLASYVGSTNPVFKAEALAGIAWRDAVWTEGYSILAQVQAGTIAQPTITSFLAMLPQMVWPT